MSHYNAYASFKTKKSIEKKELIKEKQNKQIILPTDFIIEKSSNYGIVLEVKYKTAYVLYNNEIIFELVLPTNNYRVEKMNLYNDTTLELKKEITEYYKQK